MAGGPLTQPLNRVRAGPLMLRPVHSMSARSRKGEIAPSHVPLLVPRLPADPLTSSSHV